MSPQVSYLSTAPTPAKISTKTAAEGLYLYLANRCRETSDRTSAEIEAPSLFRYRLTDAEAAEVFRLATDRLIEEGFEASHRVLPGQPWIAVFNLAWSPEADCGEGWE